jgi:hypothetical protein
MIAITREEILCHEPASNSSERVLAIIREENTILIFTFINSDLKIIAEVKTEAETSFLIRKRIHSVSKKN